MGFEEAQARILLRAGGHCLERLFQAGAAVSGYIGILKAQSVGLILLLAALALDHQLIHDVSQGPVESGGQLVQLLPVVVFGGLLDQDGEGVHET